MLDCGPLLGDWASKRASPVEASELQEFQCSSDQNLLFSLLGIDEMTKTTK